MPTRLWSKLSRLRIYFFSSVIRASLSRVPFPFGCFLLILSLYREISRQFGLNHSDGSALPRVYFYCFMYFVDRSFVYGLVTASPFICLTFLSYFSGDFDDESWLGNVGLILAILRRSMTASKSPFHRMFGMAIYPLHKRLILCLIQC